MSIISAVLGLIGLMMMFDKEESNELNYLINEKQEEDSHEIEKQKNTKFCNRKKKHDLQLLEAIKIPEVYMISIMVGFFFVGPTNFDIYFKVNYKTFILCFFSTYLKFLFQIKSFGQTFIDDDKFLTSVNAGSSVINLFLKILWGWIIDKYCFKVMI